MTKDLHHPRLIRLANTLTHGVGALLSLAGMAWLVTRAWRTGDTLDFTGAVVFGLSLVVLYTASTLYHGSTSRHLKMLFARLDYAGIFLLIGGTYTAVLLNLRDTFGWTVLGVVWLLCLAGIVFVLGFRFPGRYRLAMTFIYVALGWLVLVVLKPLIAVLPGESVIWLVAGGLAYTSGVFFFFWHKLPYHHAIWHVFVLMGSACHWVAVAGCLPAGVE